MPDAPPAGSFVVLAGLGTLCKSMAKGMGTPCFRIIQTHFSGAWASGRRLLCWLHALAACRA
jgi:hypothetical protein